MNMTKTYVVDKGWMRSPELAELIQYEPQSRFVVPDVAMVEMSKSGNWEGTMRASPRRLWQHIVERRDSDAMEFEHERSYTKTMFSKKRLELRLLVKLAPG
jgi:hypothetical protein